MTALEAAVQAAKADEETSDADLEKAKWNLDNCIIKAPVTGTILTKNAEKGNIVNPLAFSNGISASLCNMADLSDLEVDLKIQERDIPKVKNGQVCVAMPEAYQNDPEFLKAHPKGYVGKVSRLMPTADRSQGAIPVRVKLDVPKGEEGVYLKPDMGIIVQFLKGAPQVTATPPALRRPRMAAEPIVSVSNLHKFFKRGSEKIDVLEGLSLEVPEGEFLALMGPSGSGKTTLLNLVAGLDRPSEGVIRVGDRVISGMSEGQLAAWRTRHVGFVFQFYHLLPVMTAYENVELPLLLLPLSAGERREQVLTALDLVGLSNRLHHRPGQLSGGQQQRVGIARAIVTDPTVMVADEPTGDLDSKSAEEILNLLVELQKGLRKTILMVTHDPRAAARAERILHLEKGRLVHDTAATDLVFRTGAAPDCRRRRKA